MDRLVIAFALLAVGCSPVIYNRSAQFPEGSRWEIPLYRPVGNAKNPTVWTRIKVPDERSYASLPIIIDSGAFLATLPEDLFEFLGVELHANRRVRVIDADGRARPFRGAILPEMQLGELTLTDAPFGVTTRHALLGQAVLGEHPWEVDLDRGVLVIGSEPWSGADVGTVSIDSRGGVDYAEVVLDGEDVLMVVDTGATNTALDEATARELGLELRRLDRPRRVYTAHGTRVLREHAIVSELAFGEQRVESVSVTFLRNFASGGALNQKVVGLLGMNVLAQYRFRVEPGDRLQVRPRRALIETADERMGRWEWVPRCDGKRGCVRARLERSEDGEVRVARIHLQVQFDYERHLQVLFGCESGGRLVEGVPLAHFMLRDASATSGGRITLRSDDDHALKRAFADTSAQCDEELVLLDVNPWPGHRRLPAAISFDMVEPPPS